ncbi:Putative LOC100872118, partial [Caligus rogercresseyi]
MVVKNGGDVPDSDPCKLCSCHNGEVNCATQICAPPAGYENCTALPVEESICCPKYSCKPKTDAILFDDGEETEFSTTTGAPIHTSSESSLITTTGNVIGTASSDILEEIGNPDALKDEHKTSSEDVTGSQVSLDDLGPGACLYDGKVYVSAQQIPRNNPCDFCFCFRGDIICLQQSCPPPIPGCREEIIDGFCCPRYECPVTMGFKNVTEPVNKHSLVSWLFGGEEENGSKPETVTTQVRGCEIQGDFYEVGAIVKSASGPCLQC